MFKDLLVLVDESTAGAARVRYAVALATQHNAHLVGLFVAPAAPTAAFLGVEGGAAAIQALAEQFDSGVADAEAKAKAVFETTCVQAGLMWEWRSARGWPNDVAAVHARYADLTLIGQLEPEDSETWRAQPDHVALAAGRPVLATPYVGERPQPPKRAMVAWNASREATRAVNDALPLLRLAEKTTCVIINPAGEPLHGEAPGADIALHLARHGVKADVLRIDAKEPDVTALLLNATADLGADLVVMGCYGHSRMRELLLGGATRGLVKQMTTPVFLSH